MSDAATNPGQLMDAQTVADLIGVSTRQLNNYINNNGLPSQGSGKRRSFIWAEVREWLIDYRIALAFRDGNGGSEEGDFEGGTSDSDGNGNENIRAANLRKTRAEANLKELQLGKLRGEVIAIPDAKERLDRMMGNLRAKLLGLAPKLAGRLEGEKVRTAREAIIKEELENLCREISTGAIVDVAGDEDVIDEMSAAADPAFIAGVFAMSQTMAVADARALVRAARAVLSEVIDRKAAHAAVE